MNQRTRLLTSLAEACTRIEMQIVYLTTFCVKTWIFGTHRWRVEKWFMLPEWFEKFLCMFWCLFPLWKLLESVVTNINLSWPNFLQPIEVYCSIRRRFWEQYHFKQQFLLYDSSCNVKAILHHIDVLCKHRSCVTASLQTLTFSRLFPRSCTSRQFCLLNKVIWLYHGKVSSHSKPL